MDVESDFDGPTVDVAGLSSWVAPDNGERGSLSRFSLMSSITSARQAAAARYPADRSATAVELVPGTAPWSANVVAPESEVGSGFGDQTAGHQGADHGVSIDPADGIGPGSGRLPVGHHRQGLQRRAGQFGPGAVEQQPFDVGREPRPGVHPPAAAGFAHVDTASVAGVQIIGDAPRIGDPVHRLTGDRGEHLLAHRGVHDEQERFQYLEGKGILTIAILCNIKNKI